MDGSYHVGIIPAHRSSQSLIYTDLFTETMLLYCGAGHPCMARSTGPGLGQPAQLSVCQGWATTRPTWS